MYLLGQVNNFRGDTQAGLKANITESEEEVADIFEKIKNLSNFELIDTFP